MELSRQEIEQLYAAAEQGEFAARNTALLCATLYWGLTPTELSLLQVQHVMHVDGTWRERFIVPAAFAFNGLARTAWICDPRFIARLDRWLARRREYDREAGISERQRGFKAASPLFLNNQARPYAMTPRAAGSDDLLPSGMNRQLRELLDEAGLEHHSPQALRDTYIVRLWRKGLSRQEIMQLTGIRKAETITRKIRHLIPEPRDVFTDFLP